MSCKTINNNKTQVLILSNNNKNKLLKKKNSISKNSNISPNYHFLSLNTFFLPLIIMKKIMI